MNARFPLALVRYRYVFLAAAMMVLPGCESCQKPPTVEYAPKVDYNKELPDGMVALRLCKPEEYPDFAPAYDHLRFLSQAVDNSLIYMSKPSSKNFYPYKSEPPITHEQALATLRCLRQILDDCASGKISNGAQLNSVIREKFLVYKSIGAPNAEGPGFTEKVLFTGYCTPIYPASMTRTEEYKWPLYKRPPNLVTDPLTGEVKGLKQPDGSFTPCWTRQEIETGGKMAGMELCYLKSRFDAYVVTIQGSAKFKLPDGSSFEVGNDGTNGFDYTSPGKAMVADGVLQKEDLNLPKLRAFAAEKPEVMEKYLSMNKRYAFCTPRTGGPYGSLNVPVTPMRTIATDKAVYPRAMPGFPIVQVPWNASGSQQLYQGFMMDQDTGGAIRAAGRCDIFMGIGDEAEQKAGHQLNEGELFYIAIKPELIPQYSTPRPIENKKTGPAGINAVPEGPGGSKDITGAAAVKGGPDTSKLPKKDEKGPPPPGGWPKSQ